jgi:hypothetical protein
MQPTNPYPLRNNEYQTSEQWSKTFNQLPNRQAPHTGFGPVIPKRGTSSIKNGFDDERKGSRDSANYVSSNTDNSDVEADSRNKRWIPATSEEHERLSRPQEAQKKEAQAITPCPPKKTNIPIFLQFTRLPEVPPSSPSQVQGDGYNSDEGSSVSRVNTSKKWFNRSSFASMFSNVNPKLGRKDTTGTLATVLDIEAPARWKAPIAPSRFNQPLARDKKLPVPPPRKTSGYGIGQIVKTNFY